MHSGSRSISIRAKLALGMPVLRNASSRLAAQPEFGSFFAEYLILIHWMIRASVPLMRYAGVECEKRKDDTVCMAMIQYFRKHIAEESGHDDWLLDDLRVLGHVPSTVLSKMPPASVASMVGSQYYWVSHHHPVSLLGYIAVMEGTPPTDDELDMLRARTGVPEEAFRTMRKHATLDPHHKAGLDKFLDGLKLSREMEEAIVVSGLHTIASATACLEELLEKISKPRAA